jgi:hypothetical protein
MKRIYENVFHVRVRYILGLMVMAVACLGFVFGSYQHNRTFALTSEVAEIWANLDSEMKRAGQLGLRVAEQPVQLASAQRTFSHHADRVEELLTRLDQLWPELPASLQRSVRVLGPEPLELHRRFVDILRDVSSGEETAVPRGGRQLYGHYGMLDWTTT